VSSIGMTEADYRIVLAGPIRYLHSVPMSTFNQRHVPMCSVVRKDRPARVARV